MSEDRLERALQEMTQEAADTATLEAARARVWDKVANAAAAGCAEFRPELRGYLSGTLTGSRRLLLEDYVSRCSACRVALAEMKGERRVIAMPQRSSSRWRRWGTLAAAAALVLAVLYLSRDTMDAWMAPGGPRATVVSASRGLSRLSGGRSTQAPQSARRNGSAPARALTRCCASPTDRRWTSTNGRS